MWNCKGPFLLSIHHMRNMRDYFLTILCSCLKNILNYIYVNINFDFFFHSCISTAILKITVSLFRRYICNLSWSYMVDMGISSNKCPSTKCYMPVLDMTIYMYSDTGTFHGSDIHCITTLRPCYRTGRYTDFDLITIFREVSHLQRVD